MTKRNPSETIGNCTLYLGDCLKIMPTLGTVDAVITDPPYGTMDRGERKRNREKHRIDDITWDFAFDAQFILQELQKLVRQNGKVLLFSQEPYTSKLTLANVPKMQFIQRLAWEKNVAGNFLCSTKNCMQYVEDICVFRKDNYDSDKKHPLRDYFLSEQKKTGLTIPYLIKLLSSGTVSHYFTEGIQFECPTEKNYLKLQNTGFFKKPYEEIKKIDMEYQRKFPSVFNLYGRKSKSNIFKYAKDSDGYHPTQKPVALMTDLIMTYTIPGETVLDFTMGSGTTGVACVATGRKFIGIEINEKYFNVARKRICEVVKQKRLYNGGLFEEEAI